MKPGDRLYHTLEIDTRTQEEFVDITGWVDAAIHASGVRRGFCHLFCRHTTAALTVNENYDPDVKQDLLLALQHLVPDDLSYQHAEGNSPAHVKAALLGHCLTLPINAGKLDLGRWQGVLLAEFDGPRQSRSVTVAIHSLENIPG